ncbi:MAG: hypothetical protein IJ935_00265 [Afipia sp.]|nr:hypothetical protein [Afipia sp.]
MFRYYYELSVSHFLILDFSPLIGAIEHRWELIPAIRRLIAELQHSRGAAA